MHTEARTQTQAIPQLPQQKVCISKAPCALCFLSPSYSIPSLPKVFLFPGLPSWRTLPCQRCRLFRRIRDRVLFKETCFQSKRPKQICQNRFCIYGKKETKARTKKGQAQCMLCDPQQLRKKLSSKTGKGHIKKRFQSFTPQQEQEARKRITAIDPEWPSHQESQHCDGRPNQPCIFGKNETPARTYGTQHCFFCDIRTLNNPKKPIKVTTPIIQRFMSLSQRAQEIAIARVKDYYLCGHFSTCMIAKQRGEPTPSITKCPGTNQQQCTFGFNGQPSKIENLRPCNTCQTLALIQVQLHSSPTIQTEHLQLLQKLPPTTFSQLLNNTNSPEIRRKLLQSVPSKLPFEATEWSTEECHAIGKTMWTQPLERRQGQFTHQVNNLQPTKNN